MLAEVYNGKLHTDLYEFESWHETPTGRIVLRNCTFALSIGHFHKTRVLLPASYTLLIKEEETEEEISNGVHS